MNMNKSIKNNHTKRVIMKNKNIINKINYKISI